MPPITIRGRVMQPLGRRPVAPPDYEIDSGGESYGQPLPAPGTALTRYNGPALNMARFSPPATPGAGGSPIAPSGFDSGPTDAGGVYGRTMLNSYDRANNAYGDYQAGRRDLQGRIDAAGNFMPGEQQGYDPTGYFGGVGDALRGVDYSQLESYDPGAAVREYAQGAKGQFDFDLQDALEREQNAATASGRLNTGTYDKNRGMVISRLGASFQQSLADKAAQASAIKADLLSRGAALRTQRATDLDRLSYDVGATTSRLGLERAQGIDAARQRAGETALTASQRANEYGGDFYQKEQQRAGEMASGDLDRALARENARMANAHANTQDTISAVGTGVQALGTIYDIYKGTRGKAGAAGAGGTTAGGGSMLGRVGGFLKRGGTALAIDQGGRMIGNAIGGDVGRITKGAARGAAIGSIIPGVGTVAGGVIGGTYEAVKKPVAKAWGWAKKHLFSDERLKTDIVPIGDGLHEFTWKDNGRRDTGFVAQDVKRYVPGAVRMGKTGYYEVDYSRANEIIARVKLKHG